MIANQHKQLPQRRSQHYCRKNKIDKLVRYQNNAESYYYESGEHYRCIYPQTTVYLLAIKTHKHGQQNNCKQPHVLHKQFASHNEKVVTQHKKPEHHYYYCKCYYRRRQYYARAFFQEFGCLELCRQQETYKQQIKHDSNKPVKNHKNEPAYNYRATPLRLYFRITRRILLLQTEHGTLVRAAQIRQHCKVSLATVYKYALPYVIITFYCIVVEFF